MKKENDWDKRKEKENRRTDVERMLDLYKGIKKTTRAERERERENMDLYKGRKMKKEND